jgi:hypothetical protein
MLLEAMSDDSRPHNRLLRISDDAELEGLYRAVLDHIISTRRRAKRTLDAIVDLESLVEDLIRPGGFAVTEPAGFGQCSTRNAEAGDLSAPLSRFRTKNGSLPLHQRKGKDPGTVVEEAAPLAASTVAPLSIPDLTALSPSLRSAAAALSSNKSTKSASTFNGESDFQQYMRWKASFLRDMEPNETRERACPSHV